MTKKTPDELRQWLRTQPGLIARKRKAARNHEAQAAQFNAEADDLERKFLIVKRAQR